MLEEKIQEEEKKVETEKKHFNWTKLAWVFLAAPLLIYYNFALIHLTKFETADEFLWYSQGRIQQYWKAIETHDWLRTRINDKPGVTLAIVSGLAKYWEKEPAPIVDDKNRKLQYFPIDQIEEAHYNYRIPIVIFNGVMALYFYWILRRLTKSEWAALFSATLILLSPVLLGISQIINPDSLFWVFSAALLFTFLAFLDSGSILLAVLGVLLMGLTLASKYVGIIFFPFLLLAFFVHTLYRIPEWQEKGEIIWRKMLWRASNYLLTIWGGIGVFALLMPAVLVKTKFLRQSTYGSHGMYGIFKLCMIIDLVLILDAVAFKSKGVIFLTKYTKYLRIAIAKLLLLFMAGVIILVAVDWMRKLNLFQVFDMTFEGGKFDAFEALPKYKQFLLEARPFAFAQTPLVIISVVLFWLLGVVKKWKSEWIIVIITAFIPVFFLATMEQGLLIHIRYSIVLFPLASVIAGIAIAEFFDWGMLKRIPKLLIFTAVVAISVPSILAIQPFYFSYANDFLPKEYSLSDGWGYGGYEAAQYLNSLPDSGYARVVSDYTGVCQFYKGQCISYSDILRKSLKSRWNAGKYDYIVITSKGFDRFGFGDKFSEFHKQKPLWEMNIDGRPGNYVKIISSAQFKLGEADIQNDNSEANDISSNIESVAQNKSDSDADSNE